MMIKKNGRPTKLARDLRDSAIEIRVTAMEKQGFREAAALAGIPLSAWIRERLRLVAIRELEIAGQNVPFVEAIPLGGPND
jgi:hypothetical protein